MLERIISRGIGGPELAALGAAALCGIRTGGHTHHNPRRRLREIARQYGLSADSTSHWAAMWRNVREADGTLVVGDIGRELAARIEAEGKPVFPMQQFLGNSAKYLFGWLTHHGIRTLNIVGETSAELEGETCEVLVHALARLGRHPRLASPTDTCAFADGRRFYAVALWPTPMAWRWHMISAQWRPFARWRSIGPLKRGNMSAPERVWAQLPAHVRRAVVGDTETALDELVACAELGKAAEDLAGAGRWALLRLIARVYAIKGRGHAPRLRLLLRRRQRDILAGFGFPATESCVHIMAKLSRGACGFAMIGKLRQFLANDAAAVGLLRRLPAINTPVMRVLGDAWLREVIAPGCLWEFAHKSDDEGLGVSRQSSAAFALESLRDEAERTGLRDAVGPINSISQLDRVLLELRKAPNAEWPRPPAGLLGILGLIEPLTTRTALLEEGRVMRHCAGTFADAVAEGGILMFRVHAHEACGTERATLQLRPGPDGQWHTAQLRGPGNCIVSEKTRQRVEEWRTRVSAAPSCTDSSVVNPEISVGVHHVQTSCL